LRGAGGAAATENARRTGTGVAIGVCVNHQAHLCFLVSVDPFLAIVPPPGFAAESRSKEYAGGQLDQRDALAGRKISSREKMSRHQQVASISRPRTIAKGRL